MKIEEINKERLAGWETKLNKENSTPMVMVGVGHGHKAGQITVLVPEGIPVQQIITMLEGLTKGIKGGLIQLN